MRSFVWLGLDFHQWESRPEWLTWMHRMVGHGWVPIPGWIEADSEARCVRYLAFHGIDADHLDLKLIHMMDQCPDRSALAQVLVANRLDMACRRIVTVQLESPALPFPPTH
jgi:hypothetical protein